jgi:hypothetical protein
MEILSQFVEAAPTLVREFILNEVEQKINSKSSGSNGNNTNFKQLPSTPVSSHVSISNNFILSSASSSSSSSSLAQTPTSSSSCSKEEAQMQIQTAQTLTNQFDASTLVVSQSFNMLSLADILNTDDVFEPVLINFIIRQMINDPDPGNNYFQRKDFLLN